MFTESKTSSKLCSDYAVTLLVCVMLLLKNILIEIIELLSFSKIITLSLSYLNFKLYFQLQENLNSFLWLVRREPPAYFFGTIHVPYTRVWDYIPANSKRAFTTSQYVYFELDLTSKPTVSALWKCQMLPNGGFLKNVIPRSLFRRLRRHLRYIRRQMPVWLKGKNGDFGHGMAPYADKIFQLLTKDWQQKRPIWIMLLVNSLTESDVKNRGIPVLDQYLALEASRNQQITGAVEEVNEQCRPLNSLNNTQVRFCRVKIT